MLNWPWQRFTERARRVVYFAQEEAARLGQNEVSTEHLLLGLLRERDTVAGQILSRMEVNTETIRRQIEQEADRSAGRLGKEMRLAPRAKRVIDLIYDEAHQLHNDYIGTEHLLLGLIRSGEESGHPHVLSAQGVSLDVVRCEVRRIQQESQVNLGQARRQDVARTLPLSVRLRYLARRWFRV